MEWTVKASRETEAAGYNSLGCFFTEETLQLNPPSSAIHKINSIIL
jgi:hypothetical protein